MTPQQLAASLRNSLYRDLGLNYDTAAQQLIEDIYAGKDPERVIRGLAVLLNTLANVIEQDLGTSHGSTNQYQTCDGSGGSSHHTRADQAASGT